jgi:surfeit locus 1 family protein
MNPAAQQQHSFRWHADWRTTAFTGVLLPVLIGLGVWQLQRAAEKEGIARDWSVRQQLAVQALPSSQLAPAALAYLRVDLRGHFLHDRQFLLDNRMREGRYGMEVLTPLRLQGSEQLVLVNRGWVPGDPARRELPQVIPPAGPQHLQGSIYVSPGAPFTLGSPPDDGSWPRLLLALEMTEVSALLGEQVYPYSVRLEAGSPGALALDWPLLNSSTDKHRAYATQWFAMSLALLCLYLVRSSNILLWLRAWGGSSSD